MTDFAPAGFNANSTIGPHDGLRVTFAETRSSLTPDFVEEADLRDNVQHLVDALASGAPLQPASDVTVAPGELAVTLDFAVIGGGSLTVAAAMALLQDALYGPFDFLQRTYIRRVELLRGTPAPGGSSTTPWGTPIPVDVPDSETGAFAWLPYVAVGAGVLLLFVYAPEIKALAKLPSQRKRA